MSDKFIPEHVDPYRLAEQGITLEGTMKIVDMQRLGPNMNPPGDTVQVSVRFGIDEQKITYLEGHLATKLVLQCQRCMGPYTYEIISDFVLGIVNTLDEANALPERYEPALAKDGSLALRDLVEDEVILNLPIIPRHEPEECNVKLPFSDAEWEQGNNKNPFKVLEVLKGKQK